MLIELLLDNHKVVCLLCEVHEKLYECPNCEGHVCRKCINIDHETGDVFCLECTPEEEEDDE